MNKEKAKNKNYVALLFIVCLLLVTGCYFISLRPSVGGYYVKNKNNRAGNIRSEVLSQVADYCKNNSKEIPPDGEFCISGTESSHNMTIDPCELIPEGMDIKTNDKLNEDESYYWTVKYVDGEAYCAWVSEDPLEEKQLKKYEWDNQKMTYVTSPVKGQKSIVGYWDTDVKNGSGV